ncbi:MAG TPA: hypothetical protein PKK26_17620 [Candidatus Wallbacteria bacterium]|nr:hypothetical protein [Candidatus Wallbacteria bacterium]
MAAKTPDEYIKLSLKSKLSSGEKSLVTKDWLEKNSKFTVKDIEFSRNRNPHWKELKSRGSVERNEERLKKHNYKRRGGSDKRKWSDADLKKFIEKNDQHADWEMASLFKTTIPAVNYIRRKLGFAKKILAARATPKTAQNLIKYLHMAERQLHDEAAKASIFGKKKR